MGCLSQYHLRAVPWGPISTRAKRDSCARRIILDCSWPLGVSLNEGIDKDHYLGGETNLRYPTIDKVARKIYDIRVAVPVQEIMLFCENMDRAFRQLFVVPRDVPLLGSRW